MQNPLLTISYNFDFSALLPVHIKPAIDKLIEVSRSNLDNIKSVGDLRTFENTMVAFERATEGLDFACSIIGHIEAVATYPEFRDAYNSVQAQISDFYTSIYLDAELYKAIKSYSTANEAKTLKPSRARYLDKILKAFKKNGAELDSKGKDRIAKINSELTLVTNKYSQNALDSTNEFEWIAADKNSLDGLPESAISAARKSAQDKGKEGYRFTLQFPSFRAIMLYHKDPKVRELFYRTYHNRASSGQFDNSALIPQIISLRNEKASLLGFANFADFTTEDRMAGNGAVAEKFLTNLVPKIKEKFNIELEQLYKYRCELEGRGAAKLRAWDISFYSEKLRQKVCNYDPEKLRPYFKFDDVMSGLFKVANQLYGLTFKAVDGFKVWDKEVRTYQVVDSDHTVLGHFFADYFPRESKRAGAWMDSFLTGTVGRSGREETLAFMGGNFTPPIGDTPSLLTPEEVLTLFHEAGHLLHGLLGKVELPSQGINGVAWDFIELPSQFFENWCWQKEVLDLFARHYQTGEKLPQDLFDAMTRSKNFQKGMFYLRQIGLGILDFALHVHYQTQRDGDVLQYSRAILKDFYVEIPDDFSIVTSFGHIFGGPVGYAAGYYSYLWAEVLEADAFSRFEKDGILNRELGLEFRKKILEKGDTEPAKNLFFSFMQREADPNAMLRRAGLT